MTNLPLGFTRERGNEDKKTRSAQVSRPRRNPRPKVSKRQDSRLAILETFGRSCAGSGDPRTARRANRNAPNEESN